MQFSTAEAALIIESVLTSLAIVLGGIWAYFNYFKGRTYTPRMHVEVDGRVIRSESGAYLVARGVLKNLGLSSIRVYQKGTGLRVCAYISQDQLSIDDLAAYNIEPEHLGTFSVFPYHELLEPQETVEEEQLVAFPSRQVVALHLELRVVSEETSWKATRIIDVHSL